MVGNYNVAWNSCEEKLKFCSNLQVQAFNDDAENLYNLLVQYFGTSVTDINNVSCHTSSNNGCMYCLELKLNFKTEAYEETKSSKANPILQSAYYYGKRNFTLENYYNLVAKEFFQLEEGGPVYTLTEAQKINSFENGIKEPTYIHFSVTEKSEWNKLPTNRQTFDIYYDSMSESYGRFQILANPHGYRVTQKSRILQFNTGGCGRVGSGSGRGHGGIGYGRGHGCGRVRGFGGRGGCG